MKKFSAIILAAGLSTRFKENKLFSLINDKPVLYYSINVFLQFNNCQEIIIVINKDFEDEVNNLLLSFFQIEKRKIKIVFGGNTRSISSKNGIEEVKSDYFLVHDGARPNLKIALIKSVLEKLNHYEACIPVLPISDTIKRLDQNGFINSTMNRDNLVLVQTPQGFKTNSYKKILKIESNNSKQFTDDSMVVENNLKVITVKGDLTNIKITFPNDINYLLKLR